MKNNIASYTLFIKGDETKSDFDPKSLKTANSLRELMAEFNPQIKEQEDGDLIIAIGGDGTFIDSVTSTNFNKNKIYVGIHTGTLGFFQNVSTDEIFTFIKYLSHERELNTRKIHVPSVKVILKDSTEKNFFSLNEVLITGSNHKKISFSEYINGELFQNISGDGIIIATNTGDTAYSLNAGGAIDFNNNFQLVCTPLIGITNAAYERFIKNPIICSEINIKLISSSHIQIIIDGIDKELDSKSIQSVEVSIHDASNYINKFEIERYSKTNIIRTKILGYEI